MSQNLASRLLNTATHARDPAGQQINLSWVLHFTCQSDHDEEAKQLSSHILNCGSQQISEPKIFSASIPAIVSAKLHIDHVKPLSSLSVPNNR